MEVTDKRKMGNFDSSLGQSLLEGFVLTCLYTQKNINCIVMRTFFAAVEMKVRALSPDGL